MKREIILTSDGSKTIYIPEMDENYHSGHGALQEAVHVFVKNGLEVCSSAELTVFEMGFGTGLNAYLTMLHAADSGRTISYTGIEAYPVDPKLVGELDFPALLDHRFEAFFYDLHQCEWGTEHPICPSFSFKKIWGKIEDHDPEEERFDVVFFDAFGPRAQEEMWRPEILRKMWVMLKKKGILVTYCAKGQFRRDLIAIGFTVERLPGPLGKREMIRAIKA